MEILFDEPVVLGEIPPEKWHELLKKAGHDVRPLGKGNYAKVPFEQGGGFRVNWGGDRILQYHPAGRTHHGGQAYYKLKKGGSINDARDLRFNLDGSAL